MAPQASGPAFARRHGMAARIAHPAQQPLQQLPGGNSPHQLPDSALCRVQMHAAPPSAMSAPSGPPTNAPQQMAPQSRASQWLPNQQQQYRLQPVHQPLCGLHQPVSKATSMRDADGSSNSCSSRGGDMAGAQSAHAAEAPARSVRLGGGVPKSRAGACAEGMPTGACGATAKTGSGGVSLGETLRWAPNACTNGLAAKLAALCHSKNNLASTNTRNIFPSRIEAPAAPDLKHLPAQSSTPGCNEALKAQLAMLLARQSAHNCVTISRRSAGDEKSGAEKSAKKTVGRQVSKFAICLDSSDAQIQSVVIKSSKRPLASSSTEQVASTSSCVRGSSAAACGARSRAGPQPCADQQKHVEGEEVAVLDQQIGPQQEHAAEQTPLVDTPSVESRKGRQHELEIAVKRGVFHGMRAVLDSGLDPLEASR